LSNQTRNGRPCRCGFFFACAGLLAIWKLSNFIRDVERCSGTLLLHDALSVRGEWPSWSSLADRPIGGERPKETKMTLGTILLIILILLLLGAIPTWPHSRGWGYGPSGILGVVVIIIIILLVMGRL
jgi:hypothetical protein